MLLSVHRYAALCKSNPAAAAEKYIKTNRHLPEISSVKEVEKEGIRLGEMNAKLLQKIEELTLHFFEQNKELKELRSEVNQLRSKP